MEFETLRWFQEVAEGRTVTEVAETYRISQPAVSRALSRLEREIGTPLLRRSGRVLRPTLAGATLKRHLDTAIHAMDDGVAAVQQLLDPESGTVRIAFQPSLGAWLVPDLVAGFRRQHPRVVFDLVRVEGAAGGTPLVEGEIDLELTTQRGRETGVQTQRLFREPLVLAVPPGHELAERSEVWLRDAADFPFVMLTESRAVRRLTDALCVAAGVEPTISFVAQDLSTVRGFVAAGLGVAVMPASGADPSRAAVDQVSLVPLADAGAGRDIVLSWASGRRLLPAAELFRRYVLAETS